jgi:O-antigen/teichoic acid export membrane protein
MFEKFVSIKSEFLNLSGFGIGHTRTNKAKKNITFSLVLRGISIFISLIMVPLTIHYISPTKYGIWITLSSIVGWFGFFDIGLGHGLRNRFAEALASNKHALAQTYVSTTYAILTIFSLCLILLFFIINPFLNWSSILNAGTEIGFKEELSLLALIIFSTFCFSFVLRLITIILTADQEPAKASLFDFAGNILNVVIIFILTKTTKGSLLYLGLTISLTQIIVLSASSIWFYSTKYKLYKPSFRSVDFSKARDLFSLGVKFFLLQIAVVLLYQTNNIIIAQLFGPAEVTPYSIAYRYFNILMMIFTILLTPFWSAFTEAWAKTELEWINNAIKKLIKSWLLFASVGIIMLAISSLFYKIWLGKTVYIPFQMSILVLIYVLINTWNGIFSSFLNGVSKVKLQMYVGISAAVLNVPFAIFLGKWIGIEGILIANIIVFLPAVIIYPIQYKKVIKGTAQGIFNA